ncbi:MAG: histidine phosphatase family protein [Brevinematales bacterium]|nr:histidine phosphatase family protein [Brevinematales bacterium]
MKTLVLLRHAKSDWSEPDKNDFDRPLNERGVKDAPIMGKAVRNIDVPPQIIYSSDALRAKMTAEAVSSSSGAGIPIEYKNEFYNADAAEMLGFIRTIPANYESVLLIGHNPTFEELTTMMISSGQARLRFPTSALAVLKSEIDDWKDAAPGMFTLELFLNPKVVKSIAKGNNKE